MSGTEIVVRISDLMPEVDGQSVFEVQLISSDDTLRDSKQFRITGSSMDRFTEREMSDFVAQGMGEAMVAWIDRQGL